MSRLVLKAALLLSMALAETGCTSTTVTHKPDGTWTGEYRTLLKKVEADQIEAETDSSGKFRLSLSKYKSDETRVMDSFDKVLDLAKSKMP